MKDENDHEFILTLLSLVFQRRSVFAYARHGSLFFVPPNYAVQWRRGTSRPLQQRGYMVTALFVL